jgi:hypothetical protein
MYVRRQSIHLKLAHAIFIIHVYFWVGVLLFCIMFLVLNATFICVSLKSSVNLFVSLMLDIKVAHFVFWYCRPTSFVFVLIWMSHT